MPLLRTSSLVVMPALLLLGVSGCDGSALKSQEAVMSLAVATAPQQTNTLAQAQPQESCNGRARFVPGIGCEHRRPAMAEPALDEPTCELGALDRCLNDCEGGGALSCGILGKMYREGIGVRRDVRVAQKWQRRACALGGVEACEDHSKSLGARRAARQRLPRALARPLQCGPPTRPRANPGLPRRGGQAPLRRQRS
jgi:hypothetical protein